MSVFSFYSVFRALLTSSKPIRIQGLGVKKQQPHSFELLQCFLRAFELLQRFLRAFELLQCFCKA